MSIFVVCNWAWCRNKNKGGKGGKAPSVTFQDVAGADSAKAELLEVVQCFKDASRYTRLNASMPSGVLLCGPPGTGKTLLGMASLLCLYLEGLVALRSCSCLYTRSWTLGVWPNLAFRNGFCLIWFRCQSYHHLCRETWHSKIWT